MRCLVARDGVAISAALNRDLFAPFLREAFPGRTVSARLELGREDAPSAAEAAELAVKLRGAGYRVDQAQLEEAIGYKLEREEHAPLRPGFGGMAFNRRQPSAAPAEPRRAKTPTKEDAQVDKLAAAFQKDMRPVGKELLKLLETPEGGLKAACNALAKRLPKMIPASPAMADALEQEMAQAVAGEVAQKEALANSECRAKDLAHCPTHGVPVGRQEKPKTPTVGSRNPDAPEVQKAQIEKAKVAFAKCLETHEDVVDAFQRGDIGNIDVRWGKDRKGLRHLVERRDGYAKAHPGELDGRQTLEKIAEMVVRGEITEVTRKSGHNTVAIEHEGFRALLTKDDEGGNHWILSGYEISDEARGYRKKARQG